MAVTNVKIKARFKIETLNTSYDDLIDDKIGAAYPRVYPLTGVVFDATAETFKEYGQVTDSYYIMLKGMTSDATITALTVDSDSLTVADDLEEVRPGVYKVINTAYQTTGLNYAITYTSVYLLATINEIIIDMVIYEVARDPEMKGFVYKSTSDLDGIVSTTYVQPDYFYRQIERRFNQFFVRYL